MKEQTAFEVKLRFLATHYGLHHQLEKTQEELQELIEAINEHQQFHNDLTRAHIAEEVADVFVTCKQILGLMAISEYEILHRASYKVDRQLWRIESEKCRKGNLQQGI